MNLEVVNIIATVKLSAPLDLESLANRLENVEYYSGKWLKMHLIPENYYIAFYKSGKFLINGVKSLDVIEEIADRVLRILQKIDPDLSKENVTVHNMVMMGAFKLNVGLEKIVYSLNDSKVSYEPEQFPGIIYKDFGASILLFPNGKFVITGVKTFESGYVAAEKFRQIIQGVI